MNKAKIYYHDIGDYLSREAKLGILRDFGGIDNPALTWQILEPNEHGDWINKRDERFGELIPLAPDKKFDIKTQAMLTTYSLGIATHRDSWVYNFSSRRLEENIRAMLAVYDEQRASYKIAQSGNNDWEEITDPAKIVWGTNLRIERNKNAVIAFDESAITSNAIYRPFCKQNLYYKRVLVDVLYMIPKLFPTPQHQNLVICVSGVGASKEFSALITDCIPDLQLQFNGQCFPLYWYDDSTKDISDLFSTPDKEMDKYIRRDGVSDYILKLCREKYGNKSGITKEDIFYYVYGILHSPTYRETFAADLKKMLPRLPLVDSVDDFRAFSDAGRALADLHLNYETIEPYKGAIVTYGANDRVDYRVDKMRFGKSGKVEDKSTILYNNQITISNIPLEAYDYIVNGKSAIEWIMERYAVTTHKESGIRNDPNDWAAEHGNEKYILNLLLSLITVSLETNKIVAGLPKLNFE